MSTNSQNLLESYQQTNDFIASLEHTAARFGFPSNLIEKDYLCTIILQYLFDNQEHDMVFKGGTLLSKVHTNFYRLSEDLDFSISIHKR